MLPSAINTPEELDTTWLLPAATARVLEAAIVPPPERPLPAAILTLQ